MIKNIDTIKSILFDCQCALFLIDITVPESLLQIQKLFNKIKFSEFPYLKKILVENKIDQKRVISDEELKTFLDSNEFQNNVQISIKHGTGIEELAEQIKDYLNNIENNIPNNFISQIINELISDNFEEKKVDFKNNITIIFLGNSMVGKTSLFLRLNKNFYKESFISTVGIEKMSKIYKYKKELYKVNFCDTAGQDRFRTLAKSYYKNADGIFLLFDLKDKESFDDISIWMQEIKDNCSHSNNQEKGPIIFLIGNKLDLEERAVSREEAENKAGFYGIQYYEISCKLNLNIPEINSRMIIECLGNLVDKKEQNFFKVKPVKKPIKFDICCL